MALSALTAAGGTAVQKGSAVGTRMVTAATRASHEDISVAGSELRSSWREVSKTSDGVRSCSSKTESLLEPFRSHGDVLGYLR